MATTKQLEALAAVSKAGSFSGAADALGIDVASAHKRVKTLEREVGKPLVTGQQGVGSQLTQTGRVLLERSKALLNPRGRK